MKPSRFWIRLAAAAMPVMLGAVNGTAQTDKQQPGVFKGLTQNRQDPVKISAASLEVRDKKRMATFSGNVHVVQGDTEVRCNTLTVYYEAELGKAASGQAATPGSQQIRRMEARGGVTVTQKEQRASSDRADFDMRKQVVTMSGNVVLTHGDNVLVGEQLVVDLTTGVSRMVGPVKALIKSSPGQPPPKPGRPN